VTAGPRPAERNKAVVRGYLEELVNRGDWSRWDSYFGGSVLFNGRRLTRAELPAVLGFLRRFLPDVQLTIEDQVAEGDRVATRVTFRGTHTGETDGLAPTGKEVEIRGIAIDRLAGGKVVEMWHEADLHGLFRRLRRGEP
jgi:predicted ester cyclase